MGKVDKEKNFFLKRQGSLSLLLYYLSLLQGRIMAGLHISLKMDMLGDFKSPFTSLIIGTEMKCGFMGGGVLHTLTTLQAAFN